MRFVTEPWTPATFAVDVIGYFNACIPYARQTYSVLDFETEDMHKIHSEDIVFLYCRQPSIEFFEASMLDWLENYIVDYDPTIVEYQRLQTSDSFVLRIKRNNESPLVLNRHIDYYLPGDLIVHNMDTKSPQTRLANVSDLFHMQSRFSRMMCPLQEQAYNSQIHLKRLLASYTDLIVYVETPTRLTWIESVLHPKEIHQDPTRLDSHVMVLSSDKPVMVHNNTIVLSTRLFDCSCALSFFIVSDES